MRIGFVVHQFFPRHHTGTEQYVRALAREAIRRGDDARVLTHEPHLAATTPGRAVVDDDVEGIPVRRVAVARGVVANPVLADHVHPLHALLARRWLEEWRPQALHVFHLLGLGSSVLLEAADLGIPVVFHATDFWTVCPIATLTLPHGEACEGPPDGGLGCFGCLHRPVGERLDREQLVGEVQAIRDAAGALRLHRPLLGALAFGLVGRREELVARVSGARAVVAPSRFLLETLARHGFERDRLSLIPYGLDLARLEGLRERSAGPIAFGYFGTLAPHKGVHVLLEAFRAVPGDARLVVRGNPDDFPDYSARLRRLAEGDDRIALAPPFPPSGLGAALSEIDALVVPSLWHENTPFVALEALAARRGAARVALGHQADDQAETVL
ncbi:MAG TPA: glycosyltransferase, partial [Planctomycetota bacterium]|nr:glycosyltransferase [Planctomycetota bacterium]